MIVSPYLFMTYSILFSFCLIGLMACNPTVPSQVGATNTSENEADSIIIYMKPSTLENHYSGFNSVKAVNRIAEIENEYFNNYRLSCSKYYGTVWYDSAAEHFRSNDSMDLFDKYKAQLSLRNDKPDSMHCTLYAMQGLIAGLDSNFEKVDEYHKEIWKEREYAGWSIGYILTKHFNWTAYLIISPSSAEYNICISNFKKDKKYHVWKQPDIPIKEIFDVYDDVAEIDSLLSLHEFGWGFSDQGWHTWITRFNALKECNWSGAPSEEYATSGTLPLFLETPFTDYHDYTSHVLMFPPLKDQ